MTSPGAETPNNPIAAMLSQVLTEEKRKPDPCVEVVQDLKVKIADLGNACWVSLSLVWLVRQFYNELCVIRSSIISPRTSRPASIAPWRS